MENKQTAVEWLADQIESLITIETFQKWQSIKEQAVAMEKEQHGETWDMALKQMVERGYVWERAMIDFDDYWANKSKTHPGEHCEEA